MVPRLRGRGAASNPPNRFERLALEPLDSEETPPEVPTEYFDDSSRSILARNDSPDVPFTYSINPYRGCEHGCAYCFARPTHEYLGFSAGLDFETRIVVKRAAPELLEAEFRKHSWRPQPVALSGNTDCYQPVERRLELTRRCLGVFLRFRNPVSLITKSHMVTRDLDLLAEMARLKLVHVQLSITTLDARLARSMEPRASAPERRLEAVADLSRAGVPVGVSIAPVIPGLTDAEIPAIVRQAAERGATWAGYLLLRLPLGLKDLFPQWLARDCSARARRVLARIRDTRGGELYNPRFGTRKRGEGAIAASLESLFRMACRKAGLAAEPSPLSTEQFTRGAREQLRMF